MLCVVACQIYFVEPVFKT